MVNNMRNFDIKKWKLQYNTLLTEGGWASAKTQDTRLTPAIVEECIPLYKEFIDDFNKYISQFDLPPVEAGEPIGSSHYWKKDLEDTPDKEYGDIDMLFYIPRLEQYPESKNKSIYIDKIKSYLETRSDVETENGNFLIFQLPGNRWVQIDIVTAFNDSKDWAKGRMTPERGLKGAIGGFLYSAFADVFNFSINTNGIQVKEKDGMPVKFNVKKVDKLRTVSNNVKNFGEDVVKYYYSLSGKDDEPVMSKELQSTPGINPEDVKNSDIVKVVKGVGKTLEANDMFGNGALSHVSSYDDYIRQIVDIYKKKMIAGIESSKYDKAEGPEGIRKAKESKEKLKKGLDLIIQYLTQE
jgi:hypothetical protein